MYRRWCIILQLLLQFVSCRPTVASNVTHPTVVATTSTLNNRRVRSLSTIRYKMEGGREVGQQHRHLEKGFFSSLFDCIFNPSLLCAIGLPSSCICREDALRRAVLRAGNSFDNPTPIVLCTGTIIVSKPLNVTGKSFFMGCTSPNTWRACDLSGGRQHRIIEGNPIQLFLQNIRLLRGHARTPLTTTTSDPLDMMGGAICLTGGKTFMDNVILLQNTALAGGAVYVGPGAQLTIASADFIGNNATGLPNQTNRNGTLLVRPMRIEIWNQPMGMCSHNEYHFRSCR
jgi:hypothetical protein